MLRLLLRPGHWLPVLGGLVLAATAAARLTGSPERPAEPSQIAAIRDAPPSWFGLRRAALPSVESTPAERPPTPPTAVECRHGGLMIRDATGPTRWRPLSSVEPIAIPLAPLLERAERARTTQGQAPPRTAEPLYRAVAEAAELGTAPEWAGVLAQARLLELAVAAADVSAVTQAVDWLARHRPNEAVAFLPSRIAVRDPQAHDAAVRLWQSRVVALLRSESPSAAAELSTLLELLARLECDLADGNAADRLTPFGHAPHAGEAVIWVLDPASFGPSEWAAVRARLSAAVWRLSGRAGHRFAVWAGPRARDRFPRQGLSAVEPTAQRAAECFLSELSAERCGRAVSPDEWAATLRGLSSDGSLRAEPTVMVVLLTRRHAGAVPTLPWSWRLRWGAF